MKQLTMADGTKVPALPNDRTHAFADSGVRTEGAFPKTRHIAWWDHVNPTCVREFDGERWEVYAKGDAPARVSA